MNGINIRRLKHSDAYISSDNKYIIERGFKSIQITEDEFKSLKNDIDELGSKEIGTGDELCCPDSNHRLLKVLEDYNYCPNCGKKL